MLLAVAGGALAADFPAPGREGWETWQAESAEGVVPALAVVNPAAGGSKYVDSQDQSETVLEFPFVAREATTLRLRPVWWRTGDARLARMYPYPLSPAPGPDRVVPDGARAFFTAPQAGRVGVADVAAMAVVGSVEVGGYLTDLLLDADCRRVYVTDALGDRLVVLDADRLRAVAQVKLPAEPWSMVRYRDTILVACREGRSVAVVDMAEPRVLRRLAVAGPAINLELTGDPVTTLVVRLQQPAYDAQDLSALPADELQYGGAGERTSVAIGREKRYLRQAPHVLGVEKDKATTPVDVSEVTKAPPVATRFEYPLADDPGPSRLELCGKYLFFTAPAGGRIGVVSTADDKLVKTITVGGYPSDLVAAPSAERIYVADALGNRVVAIDAAKLEVVGETKVPAQPLSLAYFQHAQLQRPYIVPPTKIEKVYVACRAGKALVALDAGSGEVLGATRLDAPPRRVRPVDLLNSDWWGGSIDDRIPFALHPKVAVEPWPLYLDVKTLEPLAQPPAEAGDRAVGRTAAKIEPAGGGDAFYVKADNALVLNVGDRFLDVSAVADPQWRDQRPLSARDRPGSLTVSVDGGPEYDWTRGLWIAPSDEMFLVNDTEEYWEWNAVKLTAAPGKHVLRVKLKGPHTRLDALQVRRSPESWLALQARPEPWDVHGAVPMPGYEGLFYYDEPVRYRVSLSNQGTAPKTVRLTWTAENYMGEALKPGRAVVQLAPGETEHAEVSLQSEDLGRFALTLQAATEDGTLVKRLRFVRLPKLDHPRLLVRRDDLDEVRARVAEHPNLYRRYVDWLARMAPKGGTWPDRFLPPGVTREEMGKVAPEDMTDTARREQTYGWRMYEAAWRMVAVEFAAMYLAPERRDELMKYMEPLLRATSTSTYCQYHHHGPFFPGAVASLVDMAPDDGRAELPLYAFCKARRGDMNLMPWTLLTLEEPLKPGDRALVWRMGIFASNLERYFTSHAGSRGGTWWQSPWTGCHCPLHGQELSWIYFRNFFDEPRLFEKPFFRGFLTFHRYLDPIQDKRGVMASRRGPIGEPWRWILAAVSRHPLEKTLYRWDEWIAKLDGPLAEETQAVDKLMALEGMPYVGPVRGGQHHFTTGVSVPVAMALGWYEPGAPETRWDELPPSALFDVEGWAVLRSGWDDKATEVYLNSGLRDHTPRGVANHLMIWRAGQALIGWPALWGDDGNNTPMWGNVVVAGDAWAERWRLNLTHPRDGEHFVVNRFSKPTWTYITRDQRLIGYAPAEAGWGGGLDLHGHTETMYLHEGEIVAYQTRPEFDYVAGDGSNAWPLAEIAESYRQIVYLKPDTVVVYDRVRLGEGADGSALVLTTGPATAVEGQGFTVKAGDASLRGVVLLPERASLSLPAPPGSFQWKEQKLLRIEPAGATGRVVEYLTVFRTGDGEPPALDARMLEGLRTAGVGWTGSDGRPVEVRFNRPGAPLGGMVVLGSGGSQVRYELPTGIEDTYRCWASDPRYGAWTTQPRFDFVVLPGDRRQ